MKSIQVVAWSLTIAIAFFVSACGPLASLVGHSYTIPVSEGEWSSSAAGWLDLRVKPDGSSIPAGYVATFSAESRGSKVYLTLLARASFGPEPAMVDRTYQLRNAPPPPYDLIDAHSGRVLTTVPADMQNGTF